MFHNLLFQNHVVLKVSIFSVWKCKLGRCGKSKILQNNRRLPTCYTNCYFLKHYFCFAACGIDFTRPFIGHEFAVTLPSQNVWPPFWYFYDSTDGTFGLLKFILLTVDRQLPTLYRQLPTVDACAPSVQFQDGGERRGIVLTF